MRANFLCCETMKRKFCTSENPDKSLYSIFRYKYCWLKFVIKKSWAHTCAKANSILDFLVQAQWRLRNENYARWHFRMLDSSSRFCSRSQRLPCEVKVSPPVMLIHPEYVSCVVWLEVLSWTIQCNMKCEYNVRATSNTNKKVCYRWVHGAPRVKREARILPIEGRCL